MVDGTGRAPAELLKEWDDAAGAEVDAPAF